MGSSRSGTRAILLFSLSFAELIFSLMCCLPALRTMTFPVAVTLMRLLAAFLVLSLPPPCLASTTRGEGAARAGAGAHCDERLELRFFLREGRGFGMSFEVRERSAARRRQNVEITQIHYSLPRVFSPLFQLPTDRHNPGGLERSSGSRERRARRREGGLF